MSERVKCQRCDAMILEVTAKLNDGLCGRCILDKNKADFDTVVKSWIADPSTLPGAHGNPEPKDIALRIAASQIRSRLYPNEEDKMDNFCHDFCEAAHAKWFRKGGTGLSDKERYSLAVETFQGEVLNGGLLQYLTNESGAFAQWADEAFDAIGIPAYAEVMRNVKKLFPDGRIPENPDERLDVVEAIGDDQLEAIENPFWERYKEHKGEIRRLMYVYLKGQT